MNDDLAALAEAYGVATSYVDATGTRVDVPEETVRAVLAAMDATTTDEAPRYDAVDAGEVAERCPLPPRTWGWMAQLYGARSRASWGIGDLADLARLAEWSARDLDTGFVLVNPLHAVAPGLPQEDSPYFPSSRRFVNPLYVAIEELPELDLLDADDRAEVLRLGAEARALNDAPYVERDAVHRLKHAAFERLSRAEAPRRRAAFEAYRREQGSALEEFATWSAIAERHPGPYQRWPAGVRHPGSPHVARAREHLADRVTFHAWLQWLCDEQLAEAQRRARDAGMPVGLVLDLAVGCDPGGADAWAQQDVLANGVTVGAPPDAFNTDGQDWQVPPWRPDRLARSGFAPFRDLVRATLAHAGGIRVDHAMGLFRLYWIPDGATPAEGTYVRYPAATMLGILAAECRRAGAIAVAEDLGTVERGVPEALRARDVLGSAVLWFESGAPETYPEKTFASVTTHDLPTARGFWRDAPPADRERVRSLLEDAGLASPGASEDDLVVALHAFVAGTPSLLAGVALGDALGDPRRPNVPGPREEHPESWRVALPVALDDATNDARLRAVVDAVRTARSRGRGAR